MRYETATAYAKVAFAEYNYAASHLENARIRQRLAEMHQQHEPLASLLTRELSERDRLYHAAFWVVVGRFPTEPHREELDRDG